MFLRDNRNEFHVPRRSDGPEIIVAGSMATDIIFSQIDRFPTAKAGALGVFTGMFPGGRAANIARMAAMIAGEPGVVGLVARTGVDDNGVWRVPMQACYEAGVDTSFVVDGRAAGGTEQMPATCFVQVDTDGKVAYTFAGGAANEFCPDDVIAADPLFEDASAQFGHVLTTLNPRIDTVAHVLASAQAHALPVYLDPGGAHPNQSYEFIFEYPIELLKPNQAEAEELTGMTITSRSDVRRALRALRRDGVRNVLITLGGSGAALLTEDGEESFIDAVAAPSGVRGDSTGCGDQTIAMYASCRTAGLSRVAAAHAAVAAGSAQFLREGATPLSTAEAAAIREQARADFPFV